MSRGTLKSSTDHNKSSQTEVDVKMENYAGIKK